MSSDSPSNRPQKKEVELCHLKLQLERQVQKKLVRIEKRLQLHHRELEEAKGYREKEHVAQMLQVNFSRLKRGMKEIELEDWEREGQKVVLPLDPAMPPEKIVKMHFKLVRKLKKRLEVAAEFIAQFEREKAEWLEVKERISSTLDAGALREIQEHCALTPAVRGPVPKKKPIPRQPFKEFLTEAGEKIYVGKKDRDNDQLTFSFARGNDLWFHAANCPGSHVVLRPSKEQEISEESLLDAMTLALYYSKAKKAGSGDVTWTHCKYISKQKGAAPGSVNVSKHKNRHVKLEEKRLKRLLTP